MSPNRRFKTQRQTKQKPYLFLECISCLGHHLPSLAVCVAMPWCNLQVTWPAEVFWNIRSLILPPFMMTLVLHSPWQLSADSECPVSAPVQFPGEFGKGVSLRSVQLALKTPISSWERSVSASRWMLTAPLFSDPDGASGAGPGPPVMHKWACDSCFQFSPGQLWPLAVSTGVTLFGHPRHWQLLAYDCWDSFQSSALHLITHHRGTTDSTMVLGPYHNAIVSHAFCLGP